MSLNHQRVRQYLDAMGIQIWISKVPLANAKQSEVMLSDTDRMPSMSALHTPQNRRLRKVGPPSSPLAQPGLPASVPATRANGVSVETTQIVRVARNDVNVSRFGLCFARYQKLLVIFDVGYDSDHLDHATQSFVDDLAQAAGFDPKSRELFSQQWPMIDNKDVNQDDEAAKAVVQNKTRQLSMNKGLILVMGKIAGRFIDDGESGVAAPKVMKASAITELMGEQYTEKKDLWLQLKQLTANLR